MQKTTWQRWLPNNAPLVSGAISSVALVVIGRFGLHVPVQEVKPIVGAGISFLVAAIVHKKPTINIEQTGTGTTITASTPIAVTPDSSEVTNEELVKTGIALLAAADRRSTPPTTS